MKGMEKDYLVTFLQAIKYRVKSVVNKLRVAYCKHFC